MAAGFRRSSGGRVSGQFAASSDSGLGSPFTQAQIIHLMKAEFARARRYGIPLTCMVIRVDRIQALVDIHGAELRELLRLELSRLVSAKTRNADHLGLISEDRFLLVLPHTLAAQALVVGDRIARSFEELEVETQGSRLDLSLSVGISSSAEQDTLFFDTMLSQAETALAWAEEAGGNQCSVFDKDRFLHPGSGDSGAGED